MASPAEAVENMLEDMESFGFTVERKSDRKMTRERNTLVKTLLRFLEDVDDDMSVIEVRNALGEL